MASSEAYVTGVGMSAVGRRVTRHPMLLTVDAIKEALDEAGLTIGQIDGVSTYPGRMGGYLGFSPVGAEELVEALRIKATFFAGRSPSFTRVTGTLPAASSRPRSSARSSPRSAR